MSGFAGHSRLVSPHGCHPLGTLPAAHTPVAQGMVALPDPGQLLPQPGSSFREEIPPDVYPKCPDREPRARPLQVPMVFAAWGHCSQPAQGKGEIPAGFTRCWIEPLTTNTDKEKCPSVQSEAPAQFYHQLSGVRGGFHFLNTDTCFLLTMACCFSAIIKQQNQIQQVSPSPFSVDRTQPSRGNGSKRHPDTATEMNKTV